MARTAARLAAVVVVASATAWYLTRLVVYSPWHRFFDFRVYRGGVQWWLEGRPLYEFVLPHTSKGFTYPPFAVLVLLPTALGSLTTAEVLFTVVSAAVVIGVTWSLLAPVAQRHGWSRWFVVALAVPLVLAMEPIREALGWGQIGPFLLALVLADVAALRAGRRWAGVGIGLATAIKVTPGLLLVYLLLTGRWRPAAVAVCTFLGATLLGFALRPHDSVEYWTSALWDTGRVGAADRTANQSIMGLLARAADPGSPDRLVWAALATLAVVLGLWRAVRAARAGDELVGVTVTGLVAVLISPISWVHHLYWVVPAVVVLIDVAAGTRLHRTAPAWLQERPRTVATAAATGAVVVTAVFVSSLIWYFQGATEHHEALPLVLGNNAYVLLAVLLVAALPIRAQDAIAPGVTAARAAERTTAPPRPGGSSPR
jgi:alpha-1,2-mannosyltransferase